MACFRQVSLLYHNLFKRSAFSIEKAGKKWYDGKSRVNVKKTEVRNTDEWSGDRNEDEDVDSGMDDGKNRLEA